MKKYLAAILMMVLIITVISTGCTNQLEVTSKEEKNEPIILKYAAVDPADSATGAGILAFKDYVEEKSEGRLIVETYFNGQLGGDAQALEGTQLGTIHFSIVDSGLLGGYDPGFYVLTLPFMFPDKEIFYDKLDGELGEKLKELADESGFKIYNFADCGTRQITNTKNEFKNLSDIKNMKFRVPETEISIDTFKALGTNPTPMNFNEIYTGLQQGTIDGMEMPIELLYTCNFMEVQNYLTVVGHMEGTLPIVGSKEFFDNLPEDLQQILIDGTIEQVKVNRKVLNDSEAEYLNKMKESGVVVTELTQEVKEELYNATESVREKYIEKIGQEIMKLAK